MDQIKDRSDLQPAEAVVKRAWWHRWALIFACINLFVLISSVVNYLVVKLSLGTVVGQYNLWIALKGQIPSWYPIVIFAPAIIWFGHRFPIERQRLTQSLLVHVSLSFLFAILL